MQRHCLAHDKETGVLWWEIAHGPPGGLVGAHAVLRTVRHC